MGLTRSLSILVIMIIAFTAEAKLKPVTAADLESTCWASGWFGHYGVRAVN